MERINSVLLVDDQKENITALKSILEDKYTIYVALNGESALKVMAKVDIDIVLLDVNMPLMDGFETLENMRKEERLEHIPVIFITSESDEFNEARGLTLGAVDYIAKPYNPSIVLIKVKNQLENKMYRDDLEDLVKDRTAELVESRAAIIMGMSLLAEGRDQGTGDHIKRMQDVTRILALQVHKLHPEMLSEEEMNNTVLMAPLHDIGKVYIPDAILLKPGKLTDEEFDVIKSHTHMGGEVLRQTETFLSGYKNVLHYAVQIAESHHEKFDGTGYPYGLKGNEIPLSACICALADVYDALTSERPYKKAFTHEEASDIILKGDGRVMPQHFNPVVLKAFVESSEGIKALLLSR